MWLILCGWCGILSGCVFLCRILFIIFLLMDWCCFLGGVLCIGLCKECFGVCLFMCLLRCCCGWLLKVCICGICVGG